MIFCRISNTVDTTSEIFNFIPRQIKKISSLRITTGESGHGIITAARALIKAGAQENRKKKALADNEESEVLSID